MTNPRLAGIFLILTACSSSSNDSMDRQHVRTGKVNYDVPAAWQRQDTTLRTSTTSVWTPVNNPAKESVSIIRTVLGAPPLLTGPEGIEKLLIQSQSGLRDAHASAPTQVVTSAGMRGWQTEMDYVPTNVKQRYHRAHAVLLDGDSLVHVFYTALQPDDTREAFHLVLNSLHHGEV